MQAASTRRWRRGNIVRCLRDPSLGTGVITSIDTEHIIIYLGHNEWMTEHVPFALVSFGSNTKNIRLKDLIHDRNVTMYESLRPGDLIIMGKSKVMNALVLDVAKCRGNRASVTNVSVTVLENGVKKKLAVRRDIALIHRA